MLREKPIYNNIKDIMHNYTQGLISLWFAIVGMKHTLDKHINSSSPNKNNSQTFLHTQ